MTEDEARTKWCPFARVDLTTEVPEGRWLITTINRLWDYAMAKPKAAQACHCLASDCMAWRVNVSGEMTPDGFVENINGYCGLAGKP